jgi:tetraacyldisaccharide 4'-kinase
MIKFMNQQNYRKIISGQSKGFAAGTLRLLLYITSFFYAAAIVLRNFFYDAGLFKIHRVNAVVISIGNITTGGTGKTPLVIWLCNLLKRQNISVAVLTRGYKTTSARSPQLLSTVDLSKVDYVGGQCANRNLQAAADEPALIAKSCPDVPVIINPNRLTGAREAIEKFGAKVLVLDDGFQHRRLFRNLDIVAIDATEPFGFGKLLPAGLLREPICSLKRANAAIITRSDLTSGKELGEIQNKLLKINPNLLIAKAMHEPAEIKYFEGMEESIDCLRGKRVFAFCGIGNPDSFFQMLKKIGAVVVGQEIFDDHCRYGEDDFSILCQKAGQLNSELVITTQKDWARIKDLQQSIFSHSAVPFAYLRIEIKIIEGEDKLRRLIKEAIAGKI